MVKIRYGVGEKIAVIETPMDRCDIARIKHFYDSLPEDMQQEILVLGVANYCLQTSDSAFIRKIHKALFPDCDKKYFVRYE